MRCIIHVLQMCVRSTGDFLSLRLSVVGNKKLRTSVIGYKERDRDSCTCSALFGWLIVVRLGGIVALTCVHSKWQS
jgi:hypothetical protein